jgi:D-amino-acid dehydrogenase
MWRWGLAFLGASRAATSWENTRRVLRLALYSFEALKQIRAETGVRYDPVTGGPLKVYSDAASLAEGVAASEAQRSLGLNYRLLSPQDCVALVPALAPRASTLAGGILYPDEENGDCYAFARGLAEFCAARGASFAFDTRILRLEAEGDRITGVITDKGRLTADVYVLATGADSPLLMRPLGLQLPIIPVKGYSLTLPRALWPEAPRRPVLDETRKFGYAPLGADRLRMTGFAEIAGYDTLPRARRTRAFVKAFTGLFPQLEAALTRTALQPFCCLRPVTPDGLPILGPSRYRNLHYNIGQGHLGWTLAHGSAQIVAALIAGRDPGIDLAGYTARPGQ